MNPLEEDPSRYLLHVQKGPILFYLVRLIAVLISIPLHTAVLATGFWAALAIGGYVESDQFMTVVGVALVISLIYNVILWSICRADGFEGIGALVYFTFRLSVKHGLCLGGAFLLAMTLARSGHSNFVVWASWLGAVLMLPNVASFLFAQVARTPLLSWMFQLARPPKPAPNPLWRDPRELRKPPA